MTRQATTTFLLKKLEQFLNLRIALSLSVHYKDTAKNITSMGRSASLLKARSGSCLRAPCSPASPNLRSSTGCDRQRQAPTCRGLSLRKCKATIRSTSNDTLRQKIYRCLSQAKNKAIRQPPTCRDKTRQVATLPVHAKRLHAMMRVRCQCAKENGLSARLITSSKRANLGRRSLYASKLRIADCART